VPKEFKRKMTNVSSSSKGYTFDGGHTLSFSNSWVKGSKTSKSGFADKLPKAPAKGKKI